jgi:hypothetical protein
MALDQRTCTDIAITAAPVAAIIFNAVITIGSVVGVPTVISVVVVVGRPGA